MYIGFWTDALPELEHRARLVVLFEVDMLGIDCRTGELYFRAIGDTFPMRNIRTDRPFTYADTECAVVAVYPTLPTTMPQFEDGRMVNRSTDGLVVTYGHTWFKQ